MDISAEEERSLPLPKNWIRVIRADGSTLYKSTVTVVESEEHPYVVQALNAARKCPLPTGWVVKETTSTDGRSDYYYCNPYLGLSMWDPPSLRQCLVDCLKNAGHYGVADAIMAAAPTTTLDALNDRTDNSIATAPSDIAVAYQQFRMQQHMTTSQDQSLNQSQKVNQQWISLKDDNTGNGIKAPINYNASGTTSYKPNQPSEQTISNNASKMQIPMQENKNAIGSNIVAGTDNVERENKILPRSNTLNNTVLNNPAIRNSLVPKNSVVNNIPFANSQSDKVDHESEEEEEEEEEVEEQSSEYESDTSEETDRLRTTTQSLNSPNSNAPEVPVVYSPEAGK